jgi:hypothetical protein
MWTFRPASKPSSYAHEWTRAHSLSKELRSPRLPAFLLKSRWFCVDVHACVRTQTGCALAEMIGLGWPGAETYTRDRLTASASVGQVQRPTPATA